MRATIAIVRYANAPIGTDPPNSFSSAFSVLLLRFREVPAPAAQAEIAPAVMSAN
jgi:hypothetical protein